ncbi:hypothetical protein ACFSC4_17415 [Deinococcus malanensis]|uniref:hypothetical protein n=1 Tax=Deinococcus malanensis TaxID=1706855 RepID=UPI0036442410
MEQQLETAQAALATAPADADFVTLGQAAHDLEVQLEAKMEAWSASQAEVEAKGG